MKVKAGAAKYLSVTGVHISNICVLAALGFMPFSESRRQHVDSVLRIGVKSDGTL